jgi:hypothetical protein
MWNSAAAEALRTSLFSSTFADHGYPERTRLALKQKSRPKAALVRRRIISTLFDARAERFQRGHGRNLQKPDQASRRGITYSIEMIVAAHRCALKSMRSRFGTNPF